MDRASNIPLEVPKPETRFPFRESTNMSIIRLIFAILLPPVGVFLTVGIGGHFWLNILLTILGYFPGIIHAVWVIAKRSGRPAGGHAGGPAGGPADGPTTDR